MKKLLFCAIMALLAIGCQKEVIETPNINGEDSFTINANVEDAKPETKVSLGDNGNGISVDWQKEDNGYTDKFSVYRVSDETFVSNFTYTGTNISFIGSQLADGEYVAVFPAVDGAACPTLTERNALALDITNQTQDGALSHLNTAVRMKSLNFTVTDGVTDGNISFKHEMAILTLTFTLDEGATPQTVNLSVSNDRLQNYKLNFINIEDDATSNEYKAYFMIKPSSGNRDLKININDSNNKNLMFIINTDIEHEVGYRYNGDITSQSIGADYIQISSYAELVKIGVDAEYPLDGKYILMNDLDISNRIWKTAIGASVAEPFTGIFDGNGKKVNIITDQTSTDFALFGYINNASVKNLFLFDSKAGIIHTATNSVIENCKNINCYIDGGVNGGIVGKASDNCTISGCHTSGIIFNSIVGENSGDKIGGIVGELINSSAIGCYNESEVGNVDYSTHIGGIAGDTRSDNGGNNSIIGCYNTGIVRGFRNVGGITGYLDMANIIGCYNSDIIVETSSCGAIVGMLSKASNISQLNSCYFTGNPAVKGIGNHSETSNLGYTSEEGKFSNVYSISSLNEPTTINSMNSAIANSQIVGVNYVAGEPAFHIPPHLMAVYGAYEQVIIPTGHKQIYSREDLEKIDDSEESMAMSYVLMNDIHLDEPWTPLGYGSSVHTPFTGTFDGNGYEITGLKAFEHLDFGLFHTINSATIKNVNFYIPEILLPDKNAGIIAIYAYNSTIENCSIIKGVIDAKSGGGFVCNGVNSTFNMCSNSAYVTAKDYAGGIVGYSNSTYFSDAGITVAEVLNNKFLGCSNKENVKADQYAGGIIGYINETKTQNTDIIGCYNSGALNSEFYTHNSVIGGIVGGCDAQNGSLNIIGCYNVGFIDHLFSTNNIITLGGIIGNTTHEQCKLSIEGCYHVGEIKSNNTGTNYIGNIGGSVMSSDININNCFSVNHFGLIEAIGTIVGTPTSEHIDCIKVPSISNLNTTFVDNFVEINCVAEMNQSLRDNEIFGFGYESPGVSYDKTPYFTLNPSTQVTIGVPDGYIAIYDRAGFESIESNKKYILMNDLDFSDSDFVTTWNADTNNKLRYTTIDGNNKKIRGLNINTPDSDYVGLIGSMSGCTIKNLTLIEPKVIGRANVGAIVGLSDGYSTIENCFVHGGSVSGDDPNGRIGGIAGEHSGVTSGCHNSSNVTGAKFVGGIIGLSLIPNDTKWIVNCSNEGNITGIDAFASTKTYIGGIIGYLSEEYYSSSSFGVNGVYNIASCYNTGNISGAKSIGGLIGGVSISQSYPYIIKQKFTASIDGCYSTGDVTGEENTGGLVGSIVASVKLDANNATADINLRNSYTSGAVSGTTNTGTVAGYLAGNVEGRTTINLNKCFYYQTSSVNVGVAHIGKKENEATVNAMSFSSFLYDGGINNIINTYGVNEELSLITIDGFTPKFTINQSPYLPSVMGEKNKI